MRPLNDTIVCRNTPYDVYTVNICLLAHAVRDAKHKVKKERWKELLRNQTCDMSRVRQYHPRCRSAT